jgi:hypothetical protein
VETDYGAGRWVTRDDPAWLPGARYRLIDRYAEPVTEAPDEGDQYFIPSAYNNGCLYISRAWMGDTHDRRLFARRMIYRTAEAAAAKAREWIKANGGSVDE